MQKTARLWTVRLALATTLAAAANSALAFADDEARRAILDLREEVKTLKADLNITRNAQMQLSSEINALKEQNRQLTGRVEELTNALAVEKRSTRELFGSIDSRVSAFEPVMVVLNGESVQVQPQEKAEYDAAVLLFQDGKFKEAAVKFSRFAEKWPESPYRPDALFWWGSSAFGAEQYKTVISSQNSLLKAYPKHPRAADAMLLVGSAQAASGNPKAAAATYRKVIKTYPKSDAAVTAKQRLGN